MRKTIIALAALAAVSFVIAPAMAQQQPDEQNMRAPVAAKPEVNTPAVVIKIEEKAPVPAAQAAPTAPPVVVAIPAAPPASVAPEAKGVAKLECKPLKVTRADVGSQKKFTVTFKDADLGAMKTCNPKSEIDQTPNGVRVVVTYGSDATISLPGTMASGNAHTARCVPDKTGDVADTTLFKALWDDGLPASIELKKVDKAFYDSDAALATCKKFAAAGKVH